MSCLSPTPTPLSLQQSSSSLLLSLQPDLLQLILSFFVGDKSTSAVDGDSNQHTTNTYQNSHLEQALASMSREVDLDTLASIVLVCRVCRNAVYDPRLWKRSNDLHLLNNNSPPLLFGSAPGASFFLRKQRREGNDRSDTTALVGFVKLPKWPKQVQDGETEENNQDETEGKKEEGIWVRELASQEVFHVLDIANSATAYQVQQLLYESFVHEFCYTPQTKTPARFYQLHKERRGVLRVPFLVLQIGQRVRRVYLPQTKPPKEATMVDTHEGHLVLLQYTQKDEEVADLVEQLLQHYTLLEDSFATKQASHTSLSEQRREMWKSLVEWVCELVHVLEWPSSVAFRTAVLLQHLIDHDFFPCCPQRITASLVFCSTSLLANRMTNSTNTASSVLFDLSFGCDNRVIPNHIQVFAMAQWRTLLPHSALAAPTLLQWIQLYAKRMDLRDMECSLAQTLAWVLLPDVSWMMNPSTPSRILGACLVVMSRWTVAATTVTTDLWCGDGTGLDYKRDLVPHMDPLLQTLHNTFAQQRTPMAQTISPSTRRLLHFLPRRWPTSNST